MKMGRAALVVSGGILLSRLLGFLRNVALAGILGSTRAADTYYTAFVIPDILFYLMAGGFLTITFIPILSRHLADGDVEEGWRSFTAVFRPVAWAMVILTAVAMAAARPILELVFPRFGPDEIDQVTRLTRIIFPAQIFFVLGSLFMAVQYAHRRFLVPTLAPLVYNLGIIGGGLLWWWRGDPSPDGFIWGALTGALVGNFGLQWWGAHRLGLRLQRSVPLRHPALREYLVMALPLMLGQSVAVLDEQFLRIFGQLAPAGSIASLSYARQLNMLPVGMIAQAAGVATYPFLARLAAEGNLAELRATVGKAVRWGIFAGAGAAAAVAAAAVPAVRLAYQRGAFDPDATLAAGGLLGIYAMSIPFWAGHQIYARAFYAQRRMWVPVGIGTAVTAVAIPLYVLLFHRFGLPGLAAASASSIGLYAMVLAVVWHRQVGPDQIRSVTATFARSAVAAGLAGVAGGVAVHAVTGSGVPDVGASIVALAVAAVVVVGVYLGVGRLLGAEELTTTR